MGGAVPEFINPKCLDKQCLRFKKPARLEGMMQDYTLLLLPTEVPGAQWQGAKVGITSFDRGLCYTPVKNNLEAGRAHVQSKKSAATAASAEMGLYAATAAFMEHCGS